MLSQTAVFTRKVRDHLIPNVVIATTQTQCIDVVDELRKGNATAAVIVDQAGHAVGIVTEQDISRRMTFAVSEETAISEVMSTPVKTIDGEDYLHHAVALMQQSTIRHLPVVDNDKVIGLLEIDGVLAKLSDQTVSHINLIDHCAADTAGLKNAKINQFKVAQQLLVDELPAPEAQQFLTRLNHDLYRAVIKGCIADMAESWGPPPVPFDVIIMGSGGRGENFLTPDQDNGIIITDYPDAEHHRIDAWFVEFSERMTQRLDDVGFPLCNGYVMATNPLWRKTLSQWREQISGWISKGEGNFLRLCDIFFDFVSVYGEGELSKQLREHITVNASRPFFLREMFKVDEEHKVALGPFGWFITERKKGPDKGKINLKITGTLPLVGAVRILALWHRVSATSTLVRIDELKRLNVLTADEHDYLRGAYRHITFLLLRQQLNDAEGGLVPGNYVSPKALSKRERDMLIASFKAIRGFRSKLRTDLTGELF